MDIDFIARGIAQGTKQDLLSSEDGKGAGMVSTRSGDTLQDHIDAKEDGSISLYARTEETASSLESLAAAKRKLVGNAGATHLVETTPFITRSGFTLRGNGATLYNDNPTELDVNSQGQIALAMGTSSYYRTRTLTFYAVSSAAGNILTVGSPDGNNFSAGDRVVMVGATKYGDGVTYDVYRHYWRAIVLSATATTITLDREPPAELLADTPTIANADEGVPSGYGASDYYFADNWHLSDIILQSDRHHALGYGGAIDCTIRDVKLIGRNGFALNALQNCRFENIRFEAWRKICELAEGSIGTVVSGMTGTLADASVHLDEAGNPDVPPFFIAIGENSADCVIEKLNVSSGPNNATYGALLGAGRNNIVRDSVLRFPALTGWALNIQSSATAGNSNDDCGFENIDLYTPNCSHFLRVADAGAGVNRPSFENIRCHGAPSSDAVYIGNGNGGGKLCNVWCEAGGLYALFGTKRWTIENNYFPDGFTNNFYREFYRDNIVCNNESDASRRIKALEIYKRAQEAISSTTANNVIETFTVAPGDLGNFDEVHFRLGGTMNNDGNVHHVRVTVNINGATDTEVAHMQVNSNGSWAVEGRVEVQGNTAIECLSKVSTPTATIPVNTRITGNLNTNGLALKVEVWTETNGTVLMQTRHIAGQKAGMTPSGVFA